MGELVELLSLVGGLAKHEALVAGAKVIVRLAREHALGNA